MTPSRDAGDSNGCLDAAAVAVGRALFAVAIGVATLAALPILLPALAVDQLIRSVRR